MSAPNHVAIIPDGNRRWAKAQGLNPWEGHAQGAKQYWDVSYTAVEAGVNNVTFWAGSYDNLNKRSKLEVKFLLKLAMEELTKPDVLNQCLKQKTRFRVLGEWREFITNESSVNAIEHIEQQTQHFKNKTLTVLFAYDGQREMVHAVQELIDSGNDASAENLRAALWTAELPDVDLVIRTGGEPHWSAGFMMWHTANSQFYFTEKLWPDFDKKELKKALDDFERRERRLGK